MKRNRYPKTKPQEDATEISAARQDRSDVRWVVGTTIYAPRVSADGGGPDGKYFTVLASRMKQLRLGASIHHALHEVAWVRPATNEEVEGKIGDVRRWESQHVCAMFLVQAIRLGGTKMDRKQADLLVGDDQTGMTLHWAKMGKPLQCMLAVPAAYQAPDLHSVALLKDGSLLGYVLGSPYLADTDRPHPEIWDIESYGAGAVASYAAGRGISPLGIAPLQSQGFLHPGNTLLTAALRALVEESESELAVTADAIREEVGKHGYEIVLHKKTGSHFMMSVSISKVSP